MPNVSIFLRRLIFALIFIAIGRYAVMTMGNTGIWIVMIGVTIFYVVWWATYRRNKKK
ncbi:MAG: hypothetical protein H6636_01560 [Anaerolineales bacterium]|nr:hypothetical protein [Anaerolineales bacterium]